MDTATTMTLELPAELYNDLQSLATEEQVDLVDMLAHWTTLARQRRSWIQGWKELCTLIQQEGGMQVGATKEQVIEQMRQTRTKIFETDYAHLYR